MSGRSQPAATRKIRTWTTALKGRMRPSRALEGPEGPYKALKALIRPLKGLKVPYKALKGPYEAL